MGLFVVKFLSIIQCGLLRACFSYRFLIGNWIVWCSSGNSRVKEQDYVYSMSFRSLSGQYIGKCEEAFSTLRVSTDKTRKLVKILKIVR